MNSPDPRPIIDMASAFYESCVLFAACDLGVFERVAAEGEADAERLAEVLGADRRGARLLLDACVALGLLEKHGERYANGAAAAAFLVPGRPGDLSGSLSGSIRIARTDPARLPSP